MALTMQQLSSPIHRAIFTLTFALLAFACQSEQAPAPPGPPPAEPAPLPSPSAVVPTPDPSPSKPAHLEVPEGMVYIPGGTTQIGSTNGLPDEQPPFMAEVASFFMDIHPVTVAQFGTFVEATGFKTQAERFGNAAVLVGSPGQWQLVDGATWQYPLGPNEPKAEDDHPVTQVSWNDAVAYCEWAGKRLPTEIEWEHAARGAQNRPHRYAWGNELVVDGNHQANTWQGQFPYFNTIEDGQPYTSKVGHFGKTDLGLTDMGGNVWEWTQNWYRPYPERELPYTATEQSEKVQRGGSFLCNPSWCHGYRVSSRSHSTPETSLFHVGFRAVKDIPS